MSVLQPIVDSLPAVTAADGVIQTDAFLATCRLILPVFGEHPWCSTQRHHPHPRQPPTLLAASRHPRAPPSDTQNLPAEDTVGPTLFAHRHLTALPLSHPLPFQVP